MKTKNKILYLTLLFIIFLLLFNVKSYAGTQQWNSLNYDVTVNSDGSMDVIETWDIYISETNTAFKDFYLDSTKYSDITDVRVSRVENGTERFLTQIYEEQYHVDSGCYYALPLSSSYNKFEIAWNVGLDQSSATRTYKLYYTIEDVVKIYKDCTEVYWQFLGTDNEITGKNITGTIKLPKAVSSIEKLRVWAHGPLEGEINRTSEDTVTFTLPKLARRTMLEVRVVTEENIYSEEISDNNYQYFEKLDSILEEEMAWADRANEERESAKQKVESIKRLIILFIIVNIIIIFLFIKKIKKLHEMGKELENNYKYPDYDIDYFRDIPDEKNATPARAVYMYNFKYNNSNIRTEINKIFSATILDLSLKGIVEFEPINKDEVKIILKSNNTEVIIPDDEKIVYDLLVKSSASKGYTTVKEFEKYARKDYDEVYTKLQSLQKIVDYYEVEAGKIDSERRRKFQYWNNMRSKYLIIFVLLICFSAITFPFFVIYIGLLGCIITISRNMSKIPTLSEKGYRESKEWKALKKYMKDYSLLKEKKVPDIVLWEKFLVYATAFGISKEVIKQLKMVHPEMFNMNDTQNIHRYSYWYMISDSRYGDNYFNNFNNGLKNVYDRASSAYSAAHSSSSSGSGSGGGFSSGGGGRRRRRRLRRSLKLKSEI